MWNPRFAYEILRGGVLPKKVASSTSKICHYLNRACNSAVGGEITIFYGEERREMNRYFFHWRH